MSEEPRERNKLELAFALAKGSSIRAWARANNVPKKTARRWAHESEVRAEVEAFRRRAIDRAVGVLACRTGWAASRMCKIAGGAESESVRLRALRAILGGMMTVSRYSGLEERMAGLEAHVRAQKARKTSTAPSYSHRRGARRGVVNFSFLTYFDPFWTGVQTGIQIGEKPTRICTCRGYYHHGMGVGRLHRANKAERDFPRGELC